MGQPVKCVLYARCSTLLNQDPENQLAPLREVAKARGFVVVDEFVDHGVSGTHESRPALSRLKKAAMRGEFGIVVVAALDRIGRNTKHVLQLMDDLTSYQVALISLREGLDFSTPTGKMVLTVLSAVASLEASLISERIRTALAVKKLAAQKTGSGWRCGRPKRLTEELKLQILQLREQGQSIRQIEKSLEHRISHTVIGRVVREAAVNKP
jgi:DNA invertase Pin-like site-specific DNA recombinase